MWRAGWIAFFINDIHALKNDSPALFDAYGLS
jgi:hypothetical protein